MFLAIDIGNTNIVAALIEGDEILANGRLETNLLDEQIWQQRLDDLFAGQPAWPLGLEGAIVSSVVPAATMPLLSILRNQMKVEPLLIGAPDVKIGRKADIQRPEEAGADRIVNAVAGWARYGEPLIIIDFGTATTLDVVGGDGSFRGGAIAPGINLSIKALYEGAACLPEIDVAPPADGKAVGKNTVDAMRSGIFWGYVGLIEGIVARIQAEVGPHKVIATGGLAPLFADQIPIIEATHENLTLEGLALIYKLNSDGPGD